jgi:hypothetical protein
LNYSLAKKNQDSTSVKEEAEPLVADSVSYEFINFILHAKNSSDIHVKGSHGSLRCQVLWKNVAGRDVKPFELSKADSAALVKMDNLFTKDDVGFIFGN